MEYSVTGVFGRQPSAIELGATEYERVANVAIEADNSQTARLLARHKLAALLRIDPDQVEITEIEKVG